MNEYCFPWHPWQHDHRIAPGSEILEYMHQAVEAHGLEKYIRLRHEVASCSWDSTQARWTVTAAVRENTELDGDHSKDNRMSPSFKVFKARWIIFCTGLCNLDRVFETTIPGLDKFKGRVAHPHWWPEDVDYANKKVIIIGSGATSTTMFPVVAKTAAQTTVIQRSPAYNLTVPRSSSYDAFCKRWFSVWLAYWLVTGKELLIELVLVTIFQTWPSVGRKMLTGEAKRQLPPGYPVDVHFNPTYDPLDQRLCFTPDGEVFAALHHQNNEIITDTIDSVEKDGIRVSSGRFVPADIIVTATGLYMEFLGKSSISVDGKTLDIGELYTWRGCMLEEMPNAALVLGYFRNTWTPGATAVTRIALDVMKETMTRGRNVFATPILSEQEKRNAPRHMLIPAKSTFCLAARERMPLGMNRGPWYGRIGLWKDWTALWFGDLRKGLKFDNTDEIKSKED